MQKTDEKREKVERERRKRNGFRGVPEKTLGNDGKKEASRGRTK